jgi:hypothetical protein
MKGSQSLYLFIRRVIKQCSYNQGILLLSTTYTFLNNTLLPKLISYVEEIIEDRQCGFRHNRLTTDHIFCIHQIL